jgi:hypothetical protein
MLEGRTVALIDDDHFTTSYIERALKRAGANSIGSAASVREAISLLNQAEGRPDVACVGADFCEHSPMMLAELAQRQIPCLFIGGSPHCGSFDGPHCWLGRPFAAYQVVDAVADLIGHYASRQRVTAV